MARNGFEGSPEGTRIEGAQIEAEPSQTIDVTAIAKQATIVARKTLDRYRGPDYKYQVSDPVEEDGIRHVDILDGDRSVQSYSFDIDTGILLSVNDFAGFGNFYEFYPPSATSAGLIRLYKGYRNLGALFEIDVRLRGSGKYSIIEKASLNNRTDLEISYVPKMGNNTGQVVGLSCDKIRVSPVGIGYRAMEISKSDACFLLRGGTCEREISLKEIIKQAVIFDSDWRSQNVLNQIFPINYSGGVGLNYKNDVLSLVGYAHSLNSQIYSDPAYLVVVQTKTGRNIFARAMTVTVSPEWRIERSTATATFTVYGAECEVSLSIPGYLRPSGQENDDDVKKLKNALLPDAMAQAIAQYCQRQ